MPDTKITALAAITTVAPSADLFPIVDVSDNSMAASGTTKNITVNQLLGAGGTATLASATITGDLTVRTTGLTVNSSGVGVGVTAALGAGNIQIGAGKYLGFSGTAYITPEDNVQGARIKANQVLIDATDAKFNIAGSEAMRLNSTGLGVGVASPLAKLHVEGGGAQGRFSVASATDGRHEYFRNGVIEGIVGWDANVFKMFAFQSGGKLEFYTGGSNLRATIDSSGNLGLGVTPSANGTGYYRTFELGKAGCGLFVSTAGLSGLEYTYFSGNGVLKYNAGPEWSYGNAGPAGIYGIEDGVHKWYNAGSGSAGGVFVPTQAMTLDASGNLLVGGTSGSYRLTTLAQNPSNGLIAQFYNNATSSLNGAYLLITQFGVQDWFVGQPAGVNAFTIGTGTSSKSEYFRIDGSGNMIPTLTATAPSLATNRQMVFNLTSDTNLRISVRGADGTTRTANITLA